VQQWFCQSMRAFGERGRPLAQHRSPASRHLTAVWPDQQGKVLECFGGSETLSPICVATMRRSKITLDDHTS